LRPATIRAPSSPWRACSGSTLHYIAEAHQLLAIHAALPPTSTGTRSYAAASLKAFTAQLRGDVLVHDGRALDTYELGYSSVPRSPTSSKAAILTYTAHLTVPMRRTPCRSRALSSRDASRAALSGRTFDVRPPAPDRIDAGPKRCRNRLPRGLVQIGGAPTTQTAHPDSLRALGAHTGRSRHIGFWRGVVGTTRHDGGQPLRTPSEAERRPSTWVGALGRGAASDAHGHAGKAEPAFQSAES
jgi:hypothetical protein